LCEHRFHCLSLNVKLTAARYSEASLYAAKGKLTVLIYKHKALQEQQNGDVIMRSLWRHQHHQVLGLPCLYSAQHTVTNMQFNANKNAENHTCNEIETTW